MCTSLKYAPLHESLYLVNKETKFMSENVSTTKSIESLIDTSKLGSRFIILRNEENIPKYYVYNINEVACVHKCVPGSFIHEVIYGNVPQKLRFDIDAKAHSHKEAIKLQEEIINMMTSAIRDVWMNALFAETRLILDEENLLIMGSTGEDYPDENGNKSYKVSLHIVVAPNMFVVANNKEAEAFALKVKCKLPEHMRSYIDDGIYKSKNNLRMLGSFKTPPSHYQGLKKREKVLIRPFKDFEYCYSMITYYNNLALINTKMTNSFIDESFHTDMCLTTQQVNKAFNMLSNTEIKSFVVRDSVKNVINLNRIFPTSCEFCNRIHDKDNSLYLICFVKDSKIFVKKMCRKNKENAFSIIGSFEDSTKSDLLSSAILSYNRRKPIETGVTETINNATNILLDKKSTDKLIKYPSKRSYEDDIYEDREDKEDEYIGDYDVGDEGCFDEHLDNNDIKDSKDIRDIRAVRDTRDIRDEKDIGDKGISDKGSYNNKSMNKDEDIIRKNIDISNKNLKKNKYVTSEDENLFEKWGNKYAYVDSTMHPYVKPDEVIPATICVKAPMRMGKTKMLKDFITERFHNPDCVIRILTFRRTFASHMHERFIDLGFKLYDHTPGLLTHKRLIIQLESLHRLKIEPTDLLVLDESELIFEQLNSGLYCSFAKAFAAFHYLIKQSKHLICMDALLGDRTYRILDKIRGFNGNDMLYYVNRYDRDIEDKYLFAQSKGDWLKYLMDCLEKKEKIAIMTNSLAECKKIEEHIRQSIVGIDIGLYSSETPKSVKTRAFNDVNNVWINHDVLIVTPTVSAGVSFEKAHFDRVFGFFTNKSCPVETCIQMLGRVRSVGTSEYTIYIDCSLNCYPTNINELRRRVHQQHLYIMSDIEDSQIGFTYDSEGNIELSNTDYLQIWLENQRIRNLSKNNFTDRFIKLITKSGALALILELEGSNIEVIQEIENTHEEIGDYIKARDAEMIAGAPNITQDKYLEIRHNLNDTSANSIEVTPTEIQSYKKHNFKQFYGIDDEETILTTDIYKYNNESIKKRFINLNTINLVNKYSPELLFQAIKIKEKQHVSSIDLHIDLYYSDSLNIYDKNSKKKKDLKDSFRDHIMLNYNYSSMLHGIVHQIIVNCGWDHILDTHKKITCMNIYNNIKKNKEYLCQHIKLISDMLDKPWFFPDSNDPQYFQKFIKCVNVITKYGYGISIHKHHEKHGETLLSLEHSNEFEYDEVYERFILPGHDYNGNSRDIKINAGLIEILDQLIKIKEDREKLVLTT
jgi:hypothetical protein